MAEQMRKIALTTQGGMEAGFSGHWDRRLFFDHGN